jgi:hypothetical protein
VRTTHNKHLRNADIAAVYLNDAFAANDTAASLTEVIQGLGLKIKIEHDDSKSVPE